jgi:hypothetical protein
MANSDGVAAGALPAPGAVQLQNMPETVAEDDLAVLGDRAMAAAQSQPTADDEEWRMEHIPAGATDEAGLTAESPAALFDEPLPIHLTAAREVGNWRQLWRHITTAGAEGQGYDSDNA